MTKIKMRIPRAIRDLDDTKKMHLAQEFNTALGFRDLLKQEDLESKSWELNTDSNVSALEELYYGTLSQALYAQMLAVHEVLGLNPVAPNILKSLEGAGATEEFMKSLLRDTDGKFRPVPVRCAYKTNEDNPIYIPVNRIKTPYQSVKSIDKEKVVAITASIKEGKKLPPLVIGYDYDLHDGHHRLLASREAELTHIPCVVGGLEEEKVARAEEFYRSMFKALLRDPANVRDNYVSVDEESPFMYRGIGQTEMESIERVGYIQSKGDGNDETQGITTCYAETAEKALQYAIVNFDLYDEPRAYVLGIAKPKDAVENDRGEFEVKRPIPMGDIIYISEIDMDAYLNLDFENIYKGWNVSDILVKSWNETKHPRDSYGKFTFKNNKFNRELGKDTVTMNTIETDGGHIEIMEDSPYAPDGRNSVYEFYVDPDRRKQGIGGALIDEVKKQYGNRISAQVSNENSLKLFYKKGFRPYEKPESTEAEAIEEFWKNESLSMIPVEPVNTLVTKARNFENPVEFYMDLTDEERGNLELSGKTYKEFWESNTNNGELVSAPEWKEYTSKLSDYKLEPLTDIDAPKVEFDPHLKPFATVRGDTVLFGTEFSESPELQFQVIHHEVAHLLTNKNSMLQRMVIENPNGALGGYNLKKLYFDGIYGEYSPEEAFATAYAVFHTNPKGLKDKYPKAYALIEKVDKEMPNHREYLQSIIDIFGEKLFNNDTITKSFRESEEIIHIIEDDLGGEYNAIEQYEAHLELIKDEAIREVLEEIIADEQDHVHNLKQVLKYMKGQTDEIVNIGKSFDFDIIKANKDSLFTKMKNKLKSRLKYKRDGKPYTLSQLDELANLIKRYGVDVGKVAESLAVRGVLLGRILGDKETGGLAEMARILVDSIPDNIESARHNWELAYRDREGALHTKNVLPLHSQEENAVEWAKINAGDLINTSETALINGIRKLVVQARMERWSASQLEQALFDHFGHYNRDWRRIALTEMAMSINNGYLMTLTDGDTVTIHEADDCCQHCRRLNVGKSFTFRKQAGNAETEIWVGKNNHGKKVKEWNACVPLHPHCRGRYLRMNSTFYKMVDGKAKLKTADEILAERNK